MQRSDNRRFQRRTTMYKKPAVKQPQLELTLDHFPDLSMSYVSKEPKYTTSTEWISAVSKKTEDNVRRFSNSDSFIGKYDSEGNPAYGNLMFANGNTYYGPIFTSWPQDNEPQMIEIPDPDEEYSFIYYEDTDEQDVDPYQNYGEMVYPDGKSFWGVFCFDSSKWNN